eukprot:scaffold141292_cov36-Tisochrysis_lutea.AAC.2
MSIALWVDIESAHSILSCRVGTVDPQYRRFLIVDGHLISVRSWAPGAIPSRAGTNRGALARRRSTNAREAAARTPYILLLHHFDRSP